MKKALNVIKRFAADEDGAALVEYTVLLGILLVAVIAAIATVGTWVNAAWTHLCTTVSTAVVTCGVAA